MEQNEMIVAVIEAKEFISARENSKGVKLPIVTDLVRIVQNLLTVIEQYDKEIEAVLNMIEYQEAVVRVREGGGLENLFASLAVTVRKLDDRIKKLSHWR